MRLVGEAHKAKHMELHAALDELLADYISNNPGEKTYINMPLIKLIDWSFRQAEEPTH